MEEILLMLNINQKIKASIVLLIDENGNNIGNINTHEALLKAQNSGLDLVEINSKATPVCKIMDFSKWKYEQSKKAKKNKHQKQEIKELKFRPNTGENDLKYRAKQADKFLIKGNKVKLVVRFRGREQEHIFTTGKNLLEKFLGFLNTSFIIDSNANIESGAIKMIIALAEKK